MIHNNYVSENMRLTEKQREIINNAMSDIMATFEEAGMKLAGDDRSERVAEALATWVVDAQVAFLSLALER